MEGAADVCQQALKLGQWIGDTIADYEHDVCVSHRDLLSNGNKTLVELRCLYDVLAQIAWRCVNADHISYEITQDLNTVD